MQYDLKKDLTDKSMVALKWHGEDTKVLIYGEAEKTEVKKGDVINVSLKQARELLSYSYLWTFDGDEPVKHKYNEMVSKLAAKAARKAKKADDSEEGEEASDDEDEEISADDVDGMKKAEIVTHLKKLGASFNDQATKAELAGLLKDALAEKANGESEEESQEDTETADDSEEGEEEVTN